MLLYDYENYEIIIIINNKEKPTNIFGKVKK